MSCHDTEVVMQFLEEGDERVRGGELNLHLSLAMHNQETHVLLSQVLCMYHDLMDAHAEMNH